MFGPKKRGPKPETFLMKVNFFFIFIFLLLYLKQKSILYLFNCPLLSFFLMLLHFYELNFF